MRTTYVETLHENEGADFDGIHHHNARIKARSPATTALTCLTQTTQWSSPCGRTSIELPQVVVSDLISLDCAQALVGLGDFSCHPVDFFVLLALKLDGHGGRPKRYS